MDYTKGEWKTAEHSKDFVYCLNKRGVNRFSLQVQAGYDDKDQRTSNEELIANAALIAAAPDMYEALKAFESAFSNFDIMAKGLPAQMAAGDAVGKAREAIAKAEGKV